MLLALFKCIFHNSRIWTCLVLTLAPVSKLNSQKSHQFKQEQLINSFILSHFYHLTDFSLLLSNIHNAKTDWNLVNFMLTYYIKDYHFRLLPP